MGNRRNGRKRRVSLGKPLPETTEETAEVTEAEIERAKVSWRKHAPPGYEDLLDAEVEAGEEFDDA